MTAGTGIKSALNASVVAFSACAWLLARAEHYPLSLDAARKARNSRVQVVQGKGPLPFDKENGL